MEFSCPTSFAEVTLSILQVLNAFSSTVAQPRSIAPRKPDSEIKPYSVAEREGSTRQQNALFFCDGRRSRDGRDTSPPVTFRCRCFEQKGSTLFDPRDGRGFGRGQESNLACVVDRERSSLNPMINLLNSSASGAPESPLAVCRAAISPALPQRGVLADQDRHVCARATQAPEPKLSSRPAIPGKTPQVNAQTSLPERVACASSSFGSRLGVFSWPLEWVCNRV